MKKKFKVKDREGLHEYNIRFKQKGELITYALHRSNDSSWSPELKGKKILSIVSDGNGFTMSKAKKTLEYPQMEQLFVLLTFMHHHHSLYKGAITLSSNKKTKKLKL